jgi:ankyrin repeat protein
VKKEQALCTRPPKVVKWTWSRFPLSVGANVNAKHDAGKTPLTVAAESKQPEIAKFLREHGAVQ